MSGDNAPDTTRSLEGVQGGDQVAVRGDGQLSAGELEAHLAGLLELPHIALFFGAGSSLSAGGWTLRKIGGEFHSRTRDDPTTDAQAREARRTVERAGVDFSDVEKAWTTLSTLEQLPQGCMADGLPEAANTCRKLLLATLIRGALLGRTTQANSRAHAGEGSEAGRRVGVSVPAHRDILRKVLMSRRPGQPAPWVFTTNYDLAIEAALEAEGTAVVNGFRGTHDRTFTPRVFDLGWYSTEARGEARFGNTYVYLAKLHGSLSWLRHAGDVVEVAFPELKSALDSFVDDPLHAGEPPVVLIPPAAGKYLNTVGFVQGELFRRLAEFTAQPNSAMLVNGYSLSDPHIDRLLLGALQNPTFHLVIGAFDYRVGGDGLEPKHERLRNEKLEHLARLRHPGVTIVTGQSADFQAFAASLPDPARLDAQAQEMQRQLKRLLATNPPGRERGQQSDAE